MGSAAMQRNIEITTGALAFFCILFYINPNCAFLPFVLASVAHELGHWAVCRLTGGRVDSLRVGMVGAQMQAEFSSPASQVCSVLAGPAVNLLLAAVFLHIRFRFALINLFLAAYNLLPLLPLDGGRILQLLLWYTWPSGADKTMKIVSVLVTAGIAAWCVVATCVRHYGLWPCFFAAILLLKTGGAMTEEKFLAKST